MVHAWLPALQSDEGVSGFAKRPQIAPQGPQKAPNRVLHSPKWSIWTPVAIGTVLDPTGIDHRSYQAALLVDFCCFQPVLARSGPWVPVSGQFDLASGYQPGPANILRAKRCGLRVVRGGNHDTDWESVQTFALEIINFGPLVRLLLLLLCCSDGPSDRAQPLHVNQTAEAAR